MQPADELRDPGEQSGIAGREFGTTEIITKGNVADPQGCKAVVSSPLQGQSAWDPYVGAFVPESRKVVPGKEGRPDLNDSPE